jgi:hypothetical protein
MTIGEIDPKRRRGKNKKQPKEITEPANKLN